MRGDEPLSGRLNHARPCKEAWGSPNAAKIYRIRRPVNILVGAVGRQTCSRFRMRQFGGEWFRYAENLLPA